MKTCIFAFHFNRGIFLENLYHSASEYYPSVPFIVVDDSSDDVKSIKILKDIEKRCRVVYPRNEPTEYSTGGLHANMQFALNLAREEGFDLAIMIQDDMQFVRGITSEDIRVIEQAFNISNSSFVIYSSFLKANEGLRIEDGMMRPVVEGLCRRDMTKEEAIKKGKHTAYSATGIFSVNRFYHQVGSLRSSEKANEKMMAAAGYEMYFLEHPIMHWLPMPVTFHGRTRVFKVKIMDWLAGAGVHPIKLKPTDERNCRPGVTPYAEDALDCPSLPLVSHWSLRGGASNLGSRKGWRKHLVKYLR